MATLLDAAMRLPEMDWFETPEGFPEFGAVDFVEMTQLYRALGAPELQTLDTQNWHRTHLAIKVVVVRGLKVLLGKSRLPVAAAWRGLDEAVVSHLEAVARGQANSAHWAAIAALHKRRYGHLPAHG